MAGTLALKGPPSDIDARALDVVAIPPSALVRVSRFNTGEPFFGRSAACRFDDASKTFGTCYLGLNLAVAFAESVLHDAEPDASGFSVPTAEIASRFALGFIGRTLKLAKLYGTPLLRLGGNGEISGTFDYSVPQAWAAALVAHPEHIDGCIYVSRRVNDSLAVVLFERDGTRMSGMHLDAAVPLHHHVDYLATLAALGVTPV